MTRTVQRNKKINHDGTEAAECVESGMTTLFSEKAGDLQPLLFCLLDCLQDIDPTKGADVELVTAIYAAIGDMCRKRDGQRILNACFSYVDRSQCRVSGPAHKSRVFVVVSEVVLPALEAEPDKLMKESIVDLVGTIINEISNNSEEALLRSCASVLSRLANIDLDCVLVEIFSRADTVSGTKANVYVETLVEMCDNCATEADQTFKHLHATEIMRITDELGRLKPRYQPFPTS